MNESKEATDGTWLPETLKEWDCKAWYNVGCTRCRAREQEFCTMWRWEKPKCMRAVCERVFLSKTSHKERLALAMLKYNP